MKWFNKRRKSGKGGEKNVITEKIIRALNYTPVEYVHSDKFIADSVSPVDDMRAKLRNTAPDNLCDTILDPSIDADILNENVFGRKQYINHLDTILQLADSASEEAVKAVFLKTALTDDRNALLAEREKYLVIRDSLNEGGVKNDRKS